MTTTLQKILIALGSAIILTLFGIILYQQIQMGKQQTAIAQSLSAQKELIDGITKSASQYSTKGDIEKLITDNNTNLKAIKEDLDSLNARINTVNVVTVHSTPQVANNLPSTSTTPNPSHTETVSSDPFGFLKNQQHLTLNENFGDIKVPFGKVSFSAWQEKPWAVDISPREYKVVNVIGTDENNKNYVYNKVSVSVDNKTYDVKITKAETQQEFPTPKFNFNPRLFLGVSGGFNIQRVKGEFTPDISVGLFSYGRFKNSPDLSIAQFGLGYGTVSAKPQFTITPITYNVGQHIPLMTNAYIGPSLHINNLGDISIMSVLKVGL
jgi:hypothetical protein